MLHASRWASSSWLKVSWISALAAGVATKRAEGRKAAVNEAFRVLSEVSGVFALAAGGCHHAC